MAPKGAAPGTHDEIARTVRDHADAVTADEVAKAVGVSRVTAWRYLERLADEGTVVRQTEYGKTGRPSTRYSWRCNAHDNLLIIGHLCGCTYKKCAAHGGSVAKI